MNFRADTERGWPRPLNEERYPVPWISPSSDLAVMDPRRHRRVVEDMLCQVCGEGHQEGSDVYLFVNEASPAPRGAVAQAMDDALMHERCARLAHGRCPELRRLRQGGRLRAYRAPLSAVVLLEEGPHNNLGARLDDSQEVSW